VAMHLRQRQLPWLSQKISSAICATCGPVFIGGDNAVGDNAVRDRAPERTGFKSSPRDGNRAKLSSSGTSPAPDSPGPRLLAGPVVWPIGKGR
jgi:hypothetical protein